MGCGCARDKHYLSYFLWWPYFTFVLFSFSIRRHPFYWFGLLMGGNWVSEFYELCHGPHKTHSSSIDDCLFSSLDPPPFFVGYSFKQASFSLRCTKYNFWLCARTGVPVFFSSPILLVCTSSHSGLHTYLPGFVLVSAQYACLL